MNLINEADKPVVKKTVVIYAGRFQPFHKGHYDAYKRLVSKFGENSVYIGTSNDTSSDKSPFTFKEKKEIATKMFGIPANRFVKVNNPYKPIEILSKFDGETTQYIAAVGEKDATRLQGKYFKPYKNKAGYGYDEIGYTYPIPAESNPISGTDVRKGLGSGNQEKAKKFFLKAYPKFDKEIFNMITTKLTEGFPGGIGVGLVLPGGYINGAPTGSVDESNNTNPSSEMRPEPHPTRHEREHPADEPDWHKKNELYDPIGEIINRVITEELFEEFMNDYLGEKAPTSKLAKAIKKPAGPQPNDALDQDITYTNAKGKQAKIKARSALRLPKDHPAHIAAAKLAGPDDAPAGGPKKPPMPPVPGSKPKMPPVPGKVAGKTPPPPPPMAPPALPKAGEKGKPKMPPVPGQPGPNGQPTPEPPGKLKGADFQTSAEKDAEKPKMPPVPGQTNQSDVEKLKKASADAAKDFNMTPDPDFKGVSDDDLKQKMVQARWNASDIAKEKGEDSPEHKAAKADLYKHQSEMGKRSGDKEAAKDYDELRQDNDAEYKKSKEKDKNTSDTERKPPKDIKAAIENGYDDSINAMSDKQLDNSRKEFSDKAYDAIQAGDKKGADAAKLAYIQTSIEKLKRMPNPDNKPLKDFDFKNLKDKYEKDHGEAYKSNIEPPKKDGEQRTSSKWDSDDSGTDKPKEQPAQEKPAPETPKSPPPPPGKLQGTDFQTPAEKPKEQPAPETPPAKPAPDKSKNKSKGTISMGKEPGTYVRKNDDGTEETFSIPKRDPKVVKQELDTEVKSLQPEQQKVIETHNNPESPERQEAQKNVESFVERMGKHVGKFFAKKGKQYADTGRAIKNLATGKRMGTIEGPDGKPVHHKDFKDEVPDIDEKTGKQKKTWYGKAKTKWVDKPDLTPEQIKLKKESEHANHEQSHALKHTGMEIGMIVGGVAAGGIVSGHGIFGALHHGVAGLAKHVGVDLAKHTTFEVLGIEHPVAAGAAAFATSFIGEAKEEQEDFYDNLLKKVSQRMKTFKLSDEQLLNSIRRYKAKEQEKLSKTNISETKQNSIQHFVEYATKRLKLKETPKVTLVTGKEYADTKTSLGGYNPVSKEIFVVIGGRLTADILRTIAHEMVHRKQDELGLIRNEIKDGADGSPVENQAHAVAGILMREYGRINKQIYNENINIDVDKGDTVLMGKFKNKKVQVKDIGKDDYGMPTINGKKATTFRIGQKAQNIYEMGNKDVHFMNIIKLYRDAKFRKRINAYLFGKANMSPNANAVARELRNMGYDDITKMEKELNIQPNFDEQIKELYNDVEKYLDEVSGVTASNVADVPDGSFIKKGKKRKLDSDKSEDWYKNGGYTQTDFPKADAIFGDENAEERTITYTIDNLPNVKYVKTDFIKEGLLLEGGAYGHMSHPFDDMDLTFGDLKDIITKALEGDLGVVREKTDGQALAISWKNGRLIAARNKGHLAGAGANAMGIEDVASKFSGRGGLTDAYNFAMKDLSAAISSLSDAQQKKIFNEGGCFMNLEVIWPTSVNVIPYGQALLVFHNTVCYDIDGNAISADNGAASTLMGMIKQVNADVQEKYTIQGPPITSIPKNENLSSKQGKYISKLKKLQSEFRLNDSSSMAEYHQSWWENFVNKSKVKLQKLEKDALVRRWAFGDKSFRLNTIADKDAQKWAIQNDKVNVQKQQKDNMKPFEEIFLGVGADVLEFVGSVLTVHPDKAIRVMKEKFKSVASQVRSGGDPSKIAKLKQELARLNSLGGINKIVATEGIVFFYGGKTYKLTGTFAPLNQILGIFYE